MTMEKPGINCMKEVYGGRIHLFKDSLVHEEQSAHSAQEKQYQSRRLMCINLLQPPTTIMHKRLYKEGYG